MTNTQKHFVSICLTFTGTIIGCFVGVLLLINFATEALGFILIIASIWVMIRTIRKVIINE